MEVPDRVRRGRRRSLEGIREDPDEAPERPVKIRRHPDRISGDIPDVKM